MRVTSLSAVVAPRTGKSLKMPSCFWKRRKFATKSVYSLCV